MVDQVVVNGDAVATLRLMPECIYQTCVTSPPYWGLRDYGVVGQIGNESSPDDYVKSIVEVFREVRRTLRDDGTLWLNIGDSYARVGGTSRVCGPNAQVGNTKSGDSYRNSSPPAGFKNKDLLGIPWRVALALQTDGWYLRSDIVWAKGVSGQKTLAEELRSALSDEDVADDVIDRVIGRFDPYVGNGMPQSVTDRPTSAHEYIFLLSKQSKYHYSSDIAREAARDCGNNVTRNLRSVWTIPTKPYPGAHCATFPERLVEMCLLAGGSPGCHVLDPFCGSGTVGVISRRMGYNFTGIELNETYAAAARDRIQDPEHERKIRLANKKHRS